MNQEIKTFLDQMFAYEDTECLEPMTLIECAGTLWTWQKEGVELPDGIEDTDLKEYVDELVKKTERAEKPLEYFKVDFRETLEGFVIIEAHDEDEAETIAAEWYATEEGTAFINQRLESNGAELFVNESYAMSCDLDYEEAEKLGFTPEN